MATTTLTPERSAPPASSRADRTNLKAMGEAELEHFAADALDQSAYRGRQLFRWLYGNGAVTFSAMTDLPKDLRERLCRTARIDLARRVGLQTARDETTKALFELPSGRRVETVLIPHHDEATGEPHRLTVCVSSQVGCAMGCRFCATGKMGFHQNLTAGEIFDQVWFMDQLCRERYDRGVTNVVFMGMGEPMLNLANVRKSIGILTHEHGLHLSPRRVTVSTVGLARRIHELADDAVRYGLAVSLHAPTDEQRSAIMPINESTSTNLDALKDAVQHFADAPGQRITYEYCLFKGVNDSEEDARRLAEITRWAPSKVNLMMYNAVAGADFERTSEEQLDRFIQVLIQRGVIATVRRSRGEEIDAACGQLANDE
jgi:23S rRNA (adenine2503-C2)-methyltransferase